MKLSRLIQPRNPRFWLLVVLNALSAALSHILRSHDLPRPLELVLAAFAIANALIGIRIALRLMAEESASTTGIHQNKTNSYNK